MKFKKKKKSKIKPNLLGGIFNLHLCVFIMILNFMENTCPHQGRPNSEGLPPHPLPHTHQLFQFLNQLDQSERSVKAGTHVKETHVDVAGSVALPLPQAVLPSSGWAGGHGTVGQGQSSGFSARYIKLQQKSLKRTGLCRLIQPAGGGGVSWGVGGRDTGLEKPLPEGQSVFVRPH